MKIVIVNDHLYPDGGADLVALAGADALARSGADVSFFTADAKRPDDASERPYALVSTGQMDLGSDPNRLRSALQGLWNPAAARGLAALLRDCDPANTVVHVHSWTKALSSSVFRAAAQAEVALLCTLHDYFAVCPNGTLFNAQSRSHCLLRPMSPACIASHCDTRAYSHKLYRVARHAVQQRFSGLPARVDRFVTISGFSERLSAQYLPTDAQYVRVRNPVEVGERQAPADPGASPAFLMIARMFQPKGWELFLDACECAGVQAVAVGSGPERAVLERRYPHTRFLGQLDRDGVRQALRAARALVMPSLWYETQGLVIAEAAALGVPAIVSDTCGGAESVLHERSGLLFRQGQVEALAAALRRLADDVELARRLGRAAAERFWSDAPTPQAHARELLSVYRELLACRRAPALGGLGEAGGSC